MIKLQVIGHLGRDCQTNTVNGKNVMNFTVAHTERYRDAQGNQKEKTTWVDCAYWSDRTAVAPYLKKGTQVYVEGTPDVRTYTNKEGQPGAALTVRVMSVQLLGSKGDGPGGEQGGGNYSQGAYNQPASNYGSNTAAEKEPAGEDSSQMDDLPF